MKENTTDELNLVNTFQGYVKYEVKFSHAQFIIGQLKTIVNPKTKY